MAQSQRKPDMKKAMWAVRRMPEYLQNKYLKMREVTG